MLCCLSQNVTFYVLCAITPESGIGEKRLCPRSGLVIVAGNGDNRRLPCRHLRSKRRAAEVRQVCMMGDNPGQDLIWCLQGVVEDPLGT